jgi:hypothetical protein
MRAVLFISSLVLLISCAVKKPSCKAVYLGIDETSKVDAVGFNREYYFTIPEGPLKGGILKVLVQGNDKPYEASLLNVFKPVTSEEYGKELWVWQETRDTVNAVVRVIGQVNLIVNNEKHCFNLAYDGLIDYAPPLKVIMPELDQE